MTEIGKKAPKFRRTPQRRREQPPPNSNVDAAWRELCGRDSVSRRGSKAHEDVTDHAAKTWDDDWRKSYDQLSADASKMDMETIRCELIFRDASQLLSCAPVRCLKPLAKAKANKPKNSLKPSVKARASKLNKIIVNRQKQMRRRMQKRVGIIPQKNKCCLVSAFRGLGIKVPYVQDGPFWVLKDGSEMLRPRGYIIKPVTGICSTVLGRWVVCRDEHCIALRRKGEDNMWSIDGADRKRIDARDLDTLVKGAKIFQVPRRRNELC